MVDDTVSALTELLAAALADASLVVEDLTVVPAGSRRVLRVLVDRDLRDLDPADTDSAVPPLSLDEVADATRTVNDVLDGSPLMGERPYTLEVSSPGVGRRLAGYDGLRRNVGRLVELHGDHLVTGRIMSVGPQHVVVQPAPVKGVAAKPVEVPMDQVGYGRVQVEFNRPAGSDDEDDVLDSVVGEQGEPEEEH